jgi:hypothetical protein
MVSNSNIPLGDCETPKSVEARRTFDDERQSFSESRNKESDLDHEISLDGASSSPSVGNKPKQHNFFAKHLQIPASDASVLDESKSTATNLQSSRFSETGSKLGKIPSAESSDLLPPVEVWQTRSKAKTFAAGRGLKVHTKESPSPSIETIYILDASNPHGESSHMLPPLRTTSPGWNQGYSVEVAKARSKAQSFLAERGIKDKGSIPVDMLMDACWLNS